MMRMYRFTCYIAGASLLSGCYTLDPAGGVAPEIGQEIALDINDVGRVGLGGAMGPEISQVEGRLVSRENAEYVVAVRSVHLLRGGEQAWQGEPVHVKSEYVTSISERHFSTGRSIALGTIGVASVVFLLTRSIIGGGTEDPINPGNPGNTYRAP